MEELHWFLIAYEGKFGGGKVIGNYQRGQRAAHVTKGDIDSMTKFVSEKVEGEAVITGLSYLGHMTRAEFFGSEEK